MRSSERGSALMEFGSVAIVLFMLIFGIIDFGRALFVYHFVANAAREGTRYASVRGADCSAPMNCGANNIQTYLGSQASANGMNANQLSVQATYPVEPESPVICGTIEDSPGCTVQVVVSYPFQFVFPFLPVSPLNMSSTSAAIITQ